MSSSDNNESLAKKMVPSPIREFLQTETAGGFALIAATVVALVWANSALSDSYFELWHHELTVGTGSLAITESLEHWVNDLLMALFFFVVALEIKRELVVGELASKKTAALPAALALGGMVVPALIFTAVTLGTPDVKGWAIPMATDIAFAVAILGIAGRRAPAGSRLLLLSLAIVDDLGAIIVIALFYTAELQTIWLLGSAAAIGLALLMRFGGMGRPLLYLIPGAILWYCTYRSGVHPTLAGVALGLLTPTGEFKGRRPLEVLEHKLNPYASYIVLPIFALANAGVVLGGEEFRQALNSRLTWAVILGLFIGKPIGIVLAGAAAVKSKVATLPTGMRLRDLLPISMVAGIGFTVSLFIAGLSFVDLALDHAKAGILLGSAVSALAGLGLLFMRSKPRKKAPKQAAAS